MLTIIGAFVLAGCENSAVEASRINNATTTNASSQVPIAENSEKQASSTLLTKSPATDASAAKSAEGEPKEQEPKEQEVKSLMACNDMPATGLEATIESLKNLLDHAKCVDDFLAQYPDAKHWQDAYRIRGRMLNAAAIVNQYLLQEPAPKENLSPVQAQNRLLERSEITRLRKLLSEHVIKTIEDISIAAHRGAFHELSSDGVIMSDARPSIQGINLNRQRSGVWELGVSEISPRHEFVVLREFARRSPAFHVEGFGLVEMHIKTDDRLIDNSQGISLDCKVHLRVTQAEKKYPCDEFLRGDSGPDAVQFIVRAVGQAMGSDAKRS